MNSWPYISELDEAWERINAMGGDFDPGADFAYGFSSAVESALAIIEELGGKDPAPARAKIEESKAKAMAIYDSTIAALR